MIAPIHTVIPAKAGSPLLVEAGIIEAVLEEKLDSRFRGNDDLVVR